MGVRNKSDYKSIEELLAQFEIAPITAVIGRSVAEKLNKRSSKGVRDPKFADTIITHTALSYNIPLITNSPRDFRRFTKLQLITPFVVCILHK